MLPAPLVNPPTSPLSQTMNYGLLRRKAGCLDDLRLLGDFGLGESVERLGRAAGGIDACDNQFFLQVGELQHGIGLAVELRDDLNISPVKCRMPPMPDEAKLSAPGRALASAIRSLTFFTGSAG